MNGKTQKQGLEWNLVETITKDELSAEISTAKHYKGYILYSVRFGRSISDDRKIGHFRPQDLDKMPDLIKEVQYWIDADKEEFRKKHAKRAPHQRR